MASIIQETVEIAVADLRPYHKNPRRGDVTAIAESLAVSGQYRAIVVNKGTKTKRKFEVLAGNHTYLAAQSLGWSHVAAHLVDVNDNAAAKIVAADNRTADLADYDDAVLLELLQSLDNLEGTGYEDGDVDALLSALEGGDDSDEGAEKVKFKDKSEWEATSRRLVILDYQLDDFVWVQDRLATLAEQMQEESNAAVVIRLIEDALSEQSPRRASSKGDPA